MIQPLPEKRVTLGLNSGLKSSFKKKEETGLDLLHYPKADTTIHQHLIEWHPKEQSRLVAVCCFTVWVLSSDSQTKRVADCAPSQSFDEMS